MEHNTDFEKNKKDLWVLYIMCMCTGMYVLFLNLESYP